MAIHFIKFFNDFTNWTSSLDCDFFILYVSLIYILSDQTILGTNTGIMTSKITNERENFFDNVKKYMKKKL